MSNPLEHMLLDATAEPSALPLSLLKAITKNFSDERKLGIGGFADVYKVPLTTTRPHHLVVLLYTGSY